MEIYQGARVSYEGLGVPQPTVGLRAADRYNSAAPTGTVTPPEPIKDFGPYSHGVYQNALAHGHKLGVFASSDHISQHTSFGGVYTEKFTREGHHRGHATPGTRSPPPTRSIWNSVATVVCWARSSRPARSRGL